MQQINWKYRTKCKYSNVIKKNFLITEEAKETILDFLQGSEKMTQYNTLNVKLLNLQLSKLKCGTKNGTEVTFIKCCVKSKVR